jgi:hypothetical protein
MTFIPYADSICTAGWSWRMVDQTDSVICAADDSGAEPYKPHLAPLRLHLLPGPKPLPRLLPSQPVPVRPTVRSRAAATRRMTRPCRDRRTL